MHISSSYTKILGETNFQSREIPRSESKAKDGERKREERKRPKAGNNNGQLRIAMPGIMKIFKIWNNSLGVSIKLGFIINSQTWPKYLYIHLKLTYCFRRKFPNFMLILPWSRVQCICAHNFSYVWTPHCTSPPPHPFWPQKEI